jgi:hypothetical protein
LNQNQNSKNISQDDFLNLSPESQEEFINSGGMISSASGEVGDKKVQSGDTVIADPITVFETSSSVKK